VLCVAKDETSVDIMCRKCYNTFHRRLQQVDAVMKVSNFDAFMTNLANETIDARCVDCVLSTVGFRGVRPDPGEKHDDSKLTGFG
jgi:hypothetical protein